MEQQARVHAVSDRLRGGPGQLCALSLRHIQERRWRVPHTLHDFSCAHRRADDVLGDVHRPVLSRGKHQPLG